MMNAEEKEYMDYLIHNRTELTIQIIRHLDEIELLQKKLDIATKALDFYKKDVCGEPYVSRVAANTLIRNGRCKMKQITIYEFLKKNEGFIKDGYVAMDKDGEWTGGWKIVKGSK